MGSRGRDRADPTSKGSQSTQINGWAEDSIKKQQRDMMPKKCIQTYQSLNGQARETGRDELVWEELQRQLGVLINTVNVLSTFIS